MIVFNNVVKRYDNGYIALSGISFRISPGELVILSGHSGAGKSSLLKLIPVIERPTSGTITINGEDVSRLSRRAIPYLRRNLGLILQDNSLLFDRNVFDNVMLPLEMAGLPARDAARRVSAALERVGLAGREQEKPIGLSGGEQQRLAIARAIVNRPLILIADEPTAHLDTDYAIEIAALFNSFNDAGVTVIVSTHDTTLFSDSHPRRFILTKGALTERAVQTAPTENPQ